MYPLADLVVLRQSPPDGFGGGWFSARHFDLVHSATVSGPRVRPPSLAEGQDRFPAHDQQSRSEYLVSVLREDWESGQHKARVRLMHTAPGAGPLDTVVTGIPVPLVVRLSGGDISPFREVPTGPIGLEIRQPGQAEGARGLPAFPLEPDSSYTIVIAGCGESASDVVEGSNRPENAE